MATKEGISVEEEQLDEAVLQVVRARWERDSLVFFAVPEVKGESSVLRVLEDDLKVIATQEEVEASVGRLRKQKKLGLTFMNDGIVYDHRLIRPL